MVGRQSCWTYCITGRMIRPNRAICPYLTPEQPCITMAIRPATLIMAGNEPVTVELVLEMTNQQSAQAVRNALESYKTRLRASIQRTRRRLRTYEERYNVQTETFLREMAAEDLEGGDIEFVEWAGEAGLLQGLEAELKELEDVRYRVP